MEEVKELTAKFGTPAGRATRTSEKYLEQYGPAASKVNAPARKGESFPWQNEPPAAEGSTATALVPKDVAPGDQIVLTCSDGRRVRVIVEEA